MVGRYNPLMSLTKSRVISAIIAPLKSESKEFAKAEEIKR